MPLDVPDLADDVIRLRPPALADVDAITAAVQDPAIPRFTRVPSPYTRDDAVVWVGSATAGWQRGDQAGFVILDRATEALVGGIGVHQLDARAGPPFVGYWVDVAARGRGVATRAVWLVVGWALGPVGLTQLTAWVYADNAVSPRVLERVGFRRDPGAPELLAHAAGARPAFTFRLDRADLARTS